MIAHTDEARVFVGARVSPSRLVSINSKSKTATVCASIGVTPTKAHIIAPHAANHMIIRV